MNTAPDEKGKWNERCSAEKAPLTDPDSMFRLLFERTMDPIWLFDPENGIFVDCNDAAVKLMRSGTKENLLRTRPEDLSPPMQPNGRSSKEVAVEITKAVQELGGMRFEWVARRMDGTDVPLEVVATPIVANGRSLHVVVSRDFTEHKQAQEQVRNLNLTLEKRIAERTAELTASEARATILVEHAPEAIVVFDGDTGEFVSCNENATRLYGLPREALLRLTPTDVSPLMQPDGRATAEVVQEKMREASAGQIPVFDWVHLHSSGRHVPCEVRLVKLPAEGRNLLRASILDNTERKRRETVQQATFQISEMVHASGDLENMYGGFHRIVGGLMPAENFYIALYDAETGMISFPYFVDEKSGTPEPRKIDTGLTGYVLRTGKPLLVDRQMSQQKRQLGEAVLLEELGDLPYIESGPPAAIWLGVPLMVGKRTIGVMAVQDYENERAYGEEEKQILSFVAAQTALAIERKRAEQALRESEEKFRALFEASSQGVMLHDEHMFLEVNPAALKILGYNRPEEILGKHPSETSASIQAGGEPGDVAAARHIQNCLSKGSTRFEWLARNPRGGEVPLEVILTRIPMKGRQIIQAVIQDISERKKAEAELLKTLAREKELNALKSSFVSMVSHEFRTPLGIIMSSAEILEDYLEELEPEDRKQHLQSIQKNSRRMGELMEEVLLLGKFEAGKMNYNPGPLDLRSFCQRVVEEVLASTHQQCRIDIEFGDVPVDAVADEALLRHIFLNLLNNAVKYSDPGSNVSMALKRQGIYCVAEIRDHGIGIPEQDKPWLFNAFHRGRNVGSRNGTGLGLVIVKRCVEMHRGFISADSAQGAGTTMTVRLPLFEGMP